MPTATSAGVTVVTSDSRLIYAGRVGTGMNDAELERVWRRGFCPAVANYCD